MIDRAQSHGSGRTGWTRFALLMLGWALGLGLLYLAMARFAVNTDELAFGTETANVLGTVDGKVAHCLGADDSPDCVVAWRAAGEPPAVLWMGNSQLPAINRMQPGDRNAPQILHRDLAARGEYLVTYSQPNANLSEHALVYEAVAPIYDPKLVILPVVFDDFREQGIRQIVGDFTVDPKVEARVEASPLGTHLVPLLGGAIDKADGTVPGMSTPTLQASVEEDVNAFLSDHWRLWAERPVLRGTMGSAIHLLRNKAFGIHSYTKRSVDPVIYSARMELLDDMLTRMREEGRDVLLYIPPYRRDIDGPYVEAEYAAFRSDLAALANRHGAQFADYEGVVPSSEWATVTDTIFGFKEPDFMHFTAEGHRRFADALDRSLVEMGY